MRSDPVPATTEEAAPGAPPAQVPADPRRWLTLSILVVASFLVGIDISVVNVAVPSIIRDLHSDVPTVEWVITGYALTIATLLIIGGRLGDLYGHRRTFVIGVVLFGGGSLLASFAPSVGVLIFGEAVIEGIGAALMSPAALALLSMTFQGRERARAFAVWGAVVGASAAFGPLLGGFLTTQYSWRWSFRINVFIVPIAVVGAMLLMPKGTRRARVPIDVGGAALVASSTFLLVFAISQSATHGWWAATHDFVVGGRTVWPSAAPVSVTVVCMAASLLLFAWFVAHERRRERRDVEPLFSFAELRFRTFRLGLLTSLLLALGQLGLLFLLAVFLQEARGLSAQTTGLWLASTGVAVLVGAQLGGVIAQRTSPTTVARLGMLEEAIAFAGLLVVLAPGIDFGTIVVPLIFFGLGFGMASSQLTNVVLSEVDMEKAGVASGANTTSRQVGAALGAAMIAALLTARTVHHALAHLGALGLEPAQRARVEAAIRAAGPGARVPPGLGPEARRSLEHLLAQSVTAGARAALVFGLVVVVLGGLAALRIPRHPVPTEGGVRG